MIPITTKERDPKLILVMDEKEIEDLRGESMEEAAFCKGCNTWSGWQIYRDRIECMKCKKSHFWPIDCLDNEATKAQDIIFLVNDNH